MAKLSESDKAIGSKNIQLFKAHLLEQYKKHLQELLPLIEADEKNELANELKELLKKLENE